MISYNLSPAQREELIEKFTADPFRQAGDSITVIKNLVDRGSHEPYGEEDDPDFTVASNRDYLLNHIELFKELGLDYPEEFVSAIDLANEFLKNATPAK